MQNTQLLDLLIREGVLVNVSVRYWRGCKKLNAEDLGLDPDDVSDRLISLGHKRLFPKEATAPLALIESRTHALVQANTFPFLNGLAHFLPNAKLEQLTRRFSALEKQFSQARQHFLDQYDSLRQSALQEWNVVARKLVSDPDQLLATIAAAFPSASQIEPKFGCDLQLFQIKAPERLGLDFISLGDQQRIMQSRQEAARNARRKIQREIEKFLADCIASLREQTAQLCEDMLQSIQTGGNAVHQKTLNRLIRFIDQFKQMNFVGDQEMETQLEQVRAQLLSRTAEQYRDSALAQHQLKEGLGQLGQYARQLARADATELVQKFGQLGRRKFHLAA